jgi:hypothetical protein
MGGGGLGPLASEGSEGNSEKIIRPGRQMRRFGRAELSEEN